MTLEKELTLENKRLKIELAVAKAQLEKAETLYTLLARKYSFLLMSFNKALAAFD